MLRKIGLAALLVWTWAIHVYHIGVFVPPPHSREPDPSHKQVWIPKEKLGIHQMILTGSPYERGLASGRLTHDLLFRQESELISKLRSFFPNPIVFRTLQVLMIRWFWHADDCFEPWTREEMEGVGQSAPHEFDDLGNGYSRQIYYHGVHEVGQMMVDQKGDDLGCTVAALPFKRGWVIGRNFDFEGGRVFDDDKIMKWVFPDQGNAYVSVIWAGMVGAVTGVNDHGVYLSLNAAGARDFRRYGTPTTLALLKALQYANNADEAVEIIRQAETFITDIFMVSDRSTGKLYKIEKSPHHTDVALVNKGVVVTNHLVADSFKNDPINRFRRDELTSQARADRGARLISALEASHPRDARQAEAGILAILRDKAGLEVGNRTAIDSLIATHAAIYDESENRLFVSQGPSLAGAFTGFDLAESFRTRTPVVVRGFDRDPLVSDQLYADIKASNSELAEAERLIQKKNCSGAARLIKSAESHFSRSYAYSTALGDFQECVGNHAGALEYWKEALSRSPAYASERRYLERKLGRK